MLLNPFQDLAKTICVLLLPGIRVHLRIHSFPAMEDFIVEDTAIEKDLQLPPTPELMHGPVYHSSLLPHHQSSEAIPGTPPEASQSPQCTFCPIRYDRQCCPGWQEYSEQQRREAVTELQANTECRDWMSASPLTTTRINHNPDRPLYGSSPGLHSTSCLHGYSKGRLLALRKNRVAVQYTRGSHRNRCELRDHPRQADKQLAFAEAATSAHQHVSQYIMILRSFHCYLCYHIFCPC